MLTQPKAVTKLLAIMRTDKFCHQEATWALLSAFCGDVNFVKIFTKLGKGKAGNWGFANMCFQDGFIVSMCNYVRCHLAEMFVVHKDDVVRTRAMLLTFLDMCHLAHPLSTPENQRAISDALSFLIVNTPLNYLAISKEAWKISTTLFPNQWSELWSPD